MIVTVTMNPAVDKTLVIDRFRVGATNRATASRVHVGGKGINVARTLAGLGCEVVATGFLGDRDTFGVLATLAADGVAGDFVRVSGEVRVNVKIHDPVAAVDTEINEPGQPVDDDAVDALLEKLRMLGRRCSVMVFSGSLPPGAPEDLYARCIAEAARRGVRTVLDAAGTALRHGMSATPDVAKPNRAEAEELLGMPLADDAGLLGGAQRLLDRGPRQVVISLGPAGAISASADGVWRARPPQVTAHNTVGAGDALVAGLAFGMMRGIAAAEALRFGVALASTAVSSASPDTGSSRADALLPDVMLERIAATAVATERAPG